MITPTSITNFSRTQHELETFWIFCLLVAGKNSDSTVRVVDRLLNKVGSKTPFEYLRSLGEHGIRNALVAARAGQYNRVERAIKESLNINLSTATLEDLMKIHGVGPKTARFFLVHSRPDCKHAVLDTHVLRWMKEQGFDDVPTSTPSEKDYAKWEQLCLSMMGAHFPNMAPAHVDLLIWTKMSGRLDENIVDPLATIH